MFKQLFAATLLAAMATTSMAEGPRVWLDTDHGPIILELDEVNAPITTQNFLAYVNDGFYDDIIFHRAINGFIVQSGGFDRRFQLRQPTRSAISSEAGNGLDNSNGTIAMALVGSDVNSARTQFYINTAENSNLDGDFTVFGRVVAGMGTVSAIENLRTGVMAFSANSQYQNVPVGQPGIRRAVEVEPGGFPIMPLHTGSWFDPATSGVGLNVEVSNDASTEEGPLVAAYWYDFREGRQIWLTGAQTFEYGATEVTIDMFTFEGEGGDFQSPPSQGERETWGSLTVRFESCSDAQFSYDSPTAGQGELSLTRLTLPDGSSCQNLD